MKAHSHEKRIQAVTAYLGLGNAELVGALVKVPSGTIRAWKKEPWWADLEAQLRDEENVRADKKLTSVVDRTMDLLADRVENGDFVWDSKNSKLERRPLLARDGVRVLGELFDRREFLRRARQEKELNVQNVEQTLLRVAEQFIKIAKARREPIDITDYTEVSVETTENTELRRLDLQDPVPAEGDDEGLGWSVRPPEELDPDLSGSELGADEVNASTRSDPRGSPCDALGREGTDGSADREDDVRNGKSESILIQMANGD